MRRKVIKIGSSLGVTFPSSMLAKISTKLGSEVEIAYSARRNRIEILPIEQPELVAIDGSLAMRVAKLTEIHKAELEKLADD